jgi:WD40 repeat protein
MASQGSTYASSSNHKVIWVWDLPSGVVKSVLWGHKKEITAIAVSPDGQTIIFGDDEGKLIIWNAQNGKRLHTLEVPSRRRINSIVISQNNSKALTTSGDDPLILWDIISGVKLHVFEAPGSVRYTAKFTIDGQRIVSADNSGSIQVWNSVSYAIEHTFSKSQSSGGPILKIEFTPDGERLVSNQNGKFTIWNFTNGKEERTILVHSSTAGLPGSVANAFVLSPDGKKIYSSGNEGLKISKIDADIKMPVPGGFTEESAVWSIFINEAHSMMVSRSSKVRIWDLPSMKVSRIVEGRLGNILGIGSRSMMLTEDGKRLINIFILPKMVSAFYSIGEIEAVEVFNLETEKIERTVYIRKWVQAEKADDFATAIKIIEDGHRAVIGTRSGMIAVWDLEKEEKVQILRDLSSQDIQIYDLTITPDGQRLIYSSNPKQGKNKLTVWNLQLGEEERVFSLESIPFSLSPDGKTLLYDEAGNGYKIYDLTGEREHAVSKAGYPFEFTPDARYVITRDKDTISIWNSSLEQCYASYSPNGRATSWAYASGPELFLVGDDYGQIHFLHLEGMYL